MDKALSPYVKGGGAKKYEEELMQEALGLKPKKLLIQKKQLSEEELTELFKKESDPTKKNEKGGRELMGPQKGDTMHDATGQEVSCVEALADAPTKGLGFAAHRNAKLEKYKAEVLGTESKLEGVDGIKGEIKMELKKELMSDVDTMRLGGSSSSSGSGLKKEEADIKAEAKKEAEALKVEGLKAEELKVEPEIKNEPADAAPSAKRKHEDESPEERQKRKAEKKAKKAKKQKKSAKKAKKKLKKAAKKEKKAAKKAAKILAAKSGKAAPKSSSSSSSSSSS